MKKFIFLSVLFLILAGFTLWIFRTPLLRAIVNFLIVENDISGKYFDYGVILGGQPIDRGLYASQLFHSGFIGHIVCLGGNRPPILKINDDSCTDGRLTAVQVLKQGVPDSCISIIQEGTSTTEELQAFLEFMSDKTGQILFITNTTHTRRVQFTLRKVLKNLNFYYEIAGAPSTSFNEFFWWQSEEGLITINNEYLKLLYYCYKY